MNIAGFPGGKARFYWVNTLKQEKRRTQGRPL